MNLRAIRISKNITQADLARLSGVEVATIRAYEYGLVKRPGYDMVARLAKALGVTTEELFKDQNQ